MKSLFIALSLLLFFPSFIYAQNSLSGKITDAIDRHVLTGATVYIPDLKTGAIAGIDGSFFINNLPKGKFLVEVKSISYSSAVYTIQVDGPVKLDVSLGSAVTELHEIVVTGINHSTELKNNPIPITTISNKALTENTSTNLIDNIAQRKGINQITTGPAVSKPVIRGLGYNRIISLYDGIRQEGQQWGDEHGIEIDEFSVDRVEIIKGAGSLMYGSDGLGGVINFLTANPVENGSIIGNWTSNYQTNNGLIGNSLMNAGNINGLYWQARVSQKAAHAYANPYDKRVFNSGFHEYDVNGFIGVRRNWGYSQINISSFNQTVGLVEGERNAQGQFVRLLNNDSIADLITVPKHELKSYALFIPQQEINHVRITNNTNMYVGASRIQLTIGYQQNKRKEFGEVLNEKLKTLYFDLNSLTYNMVFFLPEKKEWQSSIGISGMTQRNENKGIEFLIPQYHFFEWGAFGFVKKQIKQLTISGGIRFDQRNISIDALSLEDGKPSNATMATEKFKAARLTFSNYSSSAGITYQLSKLISGKINASRGYRAPNVSELASNGRHEGSLRYEYGNYGLKPETSFQLDFGAVFNSEHISSEVSVFQNTIHQYIYTKKLLSQNGTDSIPDPEEPVPAYQYVQGTAQLTGGEFSVDLHPHPLDWLHFENGVSFVNAINKSQLNDSSKYLPYIPAARYQSELRADFKKINNTFTNFFVRVEFNYYAKQNHVLLENNTETPTASYSLWNTGFGTDIQNKKGTKLFSFYFTVTNLFDKAYQNHLSRLKYAAENTSTGRVGVFNAGRNCSVKIVMPLTLKRSIN